MENESNQRFIVMDFYFAGDSPDLMDDLRNYDKGATLDSLEFYTRLSCFDDHYF